MDAQKPTTETTMEDNLKSAQSWLKGLRDGIREFEFAIRTIREFSKTYNIHLEDPRIGTSEEKLAELRIKCIRYTCLDEVKMLRHVQVKDIHRIKIIELLEASEGKVTLEELPLTEEGAAAIRALMK